MTKSLRILEHVSLVEEENLFPIGVLQVQQGLGVWINYCL